MDLVIALMQSKRFWMLVTGLIVAMGQMVGMTLDPERVLAIVLILAAAIHGESIRPVARKNALSTPRIFPPSTALVMIAMVGLCLTVGCCGPTKPKPEPTPAPEPVTTIEAATESQLAMVASGYADAYVQVADEIRTGAIKTNEQMQSRLVTLTREARVQAEIPVLDELNAHLPQSDDGSWADANQVADYLQSIGQGYRRTGRKLAPPIALPTSPPTARARASRTHPVRLMPLPSSAP